MTENEYFLEKTDFENRRFGMQEMYQAYMEEDDDWDKEQEVRSGQFWHKYSSQFEINQ